MIGQICPDGQDIDQSQASLQNIPQCLTRLPGPRARPDLGGHLELNHGELAGGDPGLLVIIIIIIIIII